MFETCRSESRDFFLNWGGSVAALGLAARLFSVAAWCSCSCSDHFRDFAAVAFSSAGARVACFFRGISCHRGDLEVQRWGSVSF
jgi:hypothetical protein